MLLKRWCQVSLASFEVFSFRAFAEEPCPPDAFLTISGQITNFTDAGKWYTISEEKFLKLPTTNIITSTSWAPKKTYTGPLLARVLQLAGMKPSAKTIHLIALNNFESSFPAQDLDKYKPIIAHSWDGKRLERGKYGPLYVMFPRDDYKEFMMPGGERRLVWALCRINVE